MNRHTLLFFLICIGATLSAQVADTLRSVSGNDSVIREVVVVRDTVYLDMARSGNVVSFGPEDIIRTKGIGRYDRGIINYRFIPKGKWVGGLTASYVNFDSDDSRLLFSLIDGFDAHLRTLSIKPFVGYAFRNNTVLGVKMGYNHTVGNLGNIGIQIDDLDVTMKDMRYTEDLYSIAAFHRSYVGVDLARRFGVFNETYLGFNTGTSRFSRGLDAEIQLTDTNVYELHLGITPGVAVFITENISTELSFGVAGFKMRWENQKNNEGESGSRRKSGADFKINLLNINIGITFCL